MDLDLLYYIILTLHRAIIQLYIVKHWLLFGMEPYINIIELYKLKGIETYFKPCWERQVIVPKPVTSQFSA